MEIQGPLTIEELQEANVLAVPKLLRGTVRRRAQNALNPSKWKLAIFAVVALIFLVHFASDPQFSGNGRWIPPVLLIGIVAYQYVVGPKMARQGYARRIGRVPRVLTVDPDGLRFEDAAKSFQFRPWSAYKSWREGSLIFVLRGPQRVANIVPKRGLTPEQIDELRVQLAMHMPDSA
ncbi:MAG: YcxB family protein [Acidobacteriaceae bacterium]